MRSAGRRNPPGRPTSGLFRQAPELAERDKTLRRIARIDAAVDPDDTNPPLRPGVCECRIFRRPPDRIFERCHVSRKCRVERRANRRPTLQRGGHSSQPSGISTSIPVVVARRDRPRNTRLREPAELFSSLAEQLRIGRVDEVAGRNDPRAAWGRATGNLRAIATRHPGSAFRNAGRSNGLYESLPWLAFGVLGLSDPCRYVLRHGGQGDA